MMKKNYRMYLTLFILPFQNCGAFKASTTYNYKAPTESASAGEVAPNVPGILSAHEWHEYKSRAHANTIDCSVFASLDSDESYPLNFPDVEDVSISNTTVEQGPGSVNSSIIDYGSEMTTAYPVQNLVVNNLLVINDLGRGAFFNVRNSTKFEVKDSVLAGAGNEASGPSFGKSCALSGATQIIHLYRPDWIIVLILFSHFFF